MYKFTPINDGMDCDTKEIYEVKQDRYGNTTWSAKYPDDVEDAAENKETARYAILTIFQPGCILYKQIWGRDSAVKFAYDVPINDEKKGHLYRVYCQMVNLDGEKFGFDLVHCDISEFAELFKRGKLFEQYRGYNFRYYKSFAIGEDPGFGCPTKVTVDSRINIDTRAYGKFNPNKVSSLKALDHKKASEIVDLESDYEKDEFELYKDEPEHLIICSPLLKGYALKEKLWLEFLVDVPTDIVWSNSTFQSLVLPPSTKELIHAIATSQISNSSKFDDVISGKGKGIIFLLSGSPGIGKPLTAESVAEQMRIPLYMLLAGDLGTESKDVESTLRSVLQMVTSWNAVLLLDECDVFLEALTSNSLERNKIVSIFFRTFEYYEEILFMTTNRHLDKNAREKIWRNFLSRGEDQEHDHQITDVEIGKLADSNINGRQINNVLKTAKLLASHEGELLKLEHVRTVMSVEGNKARMHIHVSNGLVPA
ncbi:putative atpase aaa+ type core protein [Botrytis fragariae]|uniref:Putative atpase aaa+ type core protein n=1 Tax=Botrytis fragariae TaxID=1964551 RepID=A0A8H6AYF0_9HELO|nr:putative atpase aaa+ type core protein [Botrytis fragariae]KAF5875923.1 putative atpase aaa+ type core protein [Botrytis fragariae]